jgi:hypothetical protein
VIVKRLIFATQSCGKVLAPDGNGEGYISGVERVDAGIADQNALRGYTPPVTGKSVPRETQACCIASLQQ